VFMALLLGRVALGEPVAELSWPFWGTVVSGSVFVLVELHCSFVFLLQLKGLAVVAKMLLLAAAGFTSEGALGLLIVAIVIGGISSHMPGRFRYYSIFHGREVKE
ncbi:MAG: hypothetical protein V3S29_10075, partial [bacterium]